MYSFEDSATEKFIGEGAKFLLLFVLVFLSFGDQAQAAPPDTMKIWRVQVQYITAGIDDAGTDDNVKVELNAGNRTWLDSGRDDFEPGTGTNTYDLRMEGISKLSDIDFFRIEKTGSDGWAIHELSLIVNGVTIFREEFQPRLWLDDSSGSTRVFHIDDFFMRPRNEWANYAVPQTPGIVPLEDMRSRIETLAGDFVTTSGYLLMHRNGNQSVEPSTLDSNTWRVDLDFEKDDTYYNPNIDADFDLTVTCSGGRPDFAVTNINSNDVGNVQDFLSANFRPRLNAMMKNFSCFFSSHIVLAPNGDLHFNNTIVWSPEGTFVLDDGSSPLGFHLTTGKTFRLADAAPTFTATVKSKLTADAVLDLTIELPAGVALDDPSIVAVDRRGRRTVAATTVRQRDGSSVISFRDRASAQNDTGYMFRLRFSQPSDVRQQHRIAFSVRDVSDQVTPLRAESLFGFESGSVVPKGTAIQPSAYRNP